MCGEPVQVIRISHPEEVPERPEGQGNHLVLLPVQARHPGTVVQASFFLWRREIQLHRKRITAPCVLLGDVRIRSYRLLPDSLSAESLRERLMALLKHPECVFPGTPARQLSVLQRTVLDGTLNGESVSALAARLHISRSSVFSARAVLMEKMGLPNRFGFAWGMAHGVLRNMNAQVRRDDK